MRGNLAVYSNAQRCLPRAQLAHPPTPCSWSDTPPAPPPPAATVVLREGCGGGGRGGGLVPEAPRWWVGLSTASVTVLGPWCSGVVCVPPWKGQCWPKVLAGGPDPKVGIQSPVLRCSPPPPPGGTPQGEQEVGLHIGT